MAHKRFCPRCGAEITQGTFCDRCKEKRLDYEPPLIQVSEYDRTYHHGSWHHFTDIEELIKARIKEALGDKTADIELEPFEFTPRKKEKITLHAHAHTQGGEHELTATLAYRQCDYGERQQSKYFEGVLQLRNVNENILPFLHKRLEQMEYKGVFVTKTVEHKNGIDLYMTDKSGIQQLARQVQQKYGGELKVSPQLFSHDHERSKDVYRVNAFVKLPEYTLGDVISYAKPRSPEHTRHLAINKMGKVIFGIDPATGKQESFEPGHVQDVKKLEKHTTTIMATLPTLSVMDPEDYQEDEIVNANALYKSYKPGEEVTIVKTEHGVMIIE